MSDYAFTADVEGPPQLRLYIYRTEPQDDGKRWWMFTVDEYDEQGRSMPMFDTLEPRFKDVLAYPQRYASEPLEWRYMSGGQPVDLDAVAAALADEG